MAQLAVKGIFQDGKIIPLEDISSQEPGNVMIVFLDDDQSRYHTKNWQTAEKQASEDYRSGNIKSASGVDEMFEKIEGQLDGRPRHVADF